MKETKTYQAEELITELLEKFQTDTMTFLNEKGLHYLQIAPVIEACHLTGAARAAILNSSAKDAFMARVSAHFDADYAEAEKLGILKDLKEMEDNAARSVSEVQG